MNVKPITLSIGKHPKPFDEEGNATLCIQEYTAYLAGESHSDKPKCVSPVLTTFMVPFNDVLDEDTRQRLRPYAVRQIGTAGDGQDEARSFMALDWLIRTYTPAFLVAARLTEEADKLRGLAAIEGLEQAQAAGPQVHAARDAARDAAEAAARSASWDATWAAIWATAASAARAADAARDAGSAATRAAWSAGGAVAAVAAARKAAYAAAAAAGAALRPTVEFLQESAFLLLDRMVDPAGIHDVQTEQLYLERASRSL